MKVETKTTIKRDLVMGIIKKKNITTWNTKGYLKLY